MDSDVTPEMKGDIRNIFPVYREALIKYKDLLTTKIFEKSEQIRNEFRSFAKVNGLTVLAVPESLEAFEGEKLKIRLTFLHPQPDRAQMFLTIFFSSPKEFYITIFHTKDAVKEKFLENEITSDDIKVLSRLYDSLQVSDVSISLLDKDRLTDSEDAKEYTNFIDIIEQLYSTPRKF